MPRVGLRLAASIVLVAIGLTLVAVDHTGLHLVALSYGGGKQEVASGFLLCGFLDGKLYIAREEEGGVTLKPLYPGSGFTVDDGYELPVAGRVVDCRLCDGVARLMLSCSGCGGPGLRVGGVYAKHAVAYYSLPNGILCSIAASGPLQGYIGLFAIHAGGKKVLGRRVLRGLRGGAPGPE